MMYWVSEEFYLSFVVTPVCLWHLPLLANSDGLSKVCAVVGIGSWFQADLAYHPSVCSHFYSWGSAWWVWRRLTTFTWLWTSSRNGKYFSWWIEHLRTWYRWNKSVWMWRSAWENTEWRWVWDRYLHVWTICGGRWWGWIRYF